MWRPLWNQLWTISAVQFLILAQAMFGVYFVKILLPFGEFLEKTGTLKDSPLYIIASISESGTVLGTTISAICMKYLGRRITYGAFIIPGAISWFMVQFAPNITTVIVGVFFGALSTGGTVALGSIVTAEFCSPKYRGLYLALSYLIPALGFIIGLLLLFYTQLYVLALVGLQFQILAIFIVYFWPESPLWLASKKQFKKCEEAFYWLRGESEESREELEDMINLYKSLDSKPKVKLSAGKKIVKYLLRFTKSDFLEPLGIMVAANVMIQITGREFALTVMPVLITKLERVEINFMRVASVGTLFTTIVSLILVKFMKRRTMIFSGGLTALLVLMAVLAYLLAMVINATTVDHRALIRWFIAIYFVVSSIGCSPLSIILAGELFPLAHKGIGSAATSISSSALKLIVHKLVSDLMEYPFWSISLVIFVYVITMGVCLGVLYIKLPETKDKTLQEIERYFKKGRFNLNPLAPVSNIEFELME